MKRKKLFGRPNTLSDSSVVLRGKTFVNTLPTASDSTAYARPTGISGADSPCRRLCFGLDSSIPFISFIANGKLFKLV